MHIDPNSSAYPNSTGGNGLTKFEFAVIEITKGLAANPSYHNSKKDCVTREAINQAVSILDRINNFWKDLEEQPKGD